MAVADALVALDPGIRITALGTHRGLETKLVPERGYELALITPVPLPRKPTGDLARLPFRVRTAVRADASSARRRRTPTSSSDSVATSRCPPTSPPAAAHSADTGCPSSSTRPTRGRGWPTASVPAPRHRVLSAVSNPGLGRAAEVVGVPVRASITSLDRTALRAEAREFFGFSDDARVLLVFGGSQGAQSLNRAVSGAAEKLAAAGISVLHAHGPKNVLELREPAEADPPYVAVPYLSRMDLAYAAADLAICRSGAMTVAEVSAVGLPAIYVPLPIGNGEQRLNALPVVDAGGGLVVSDGALTPEFVADTVSGLLGDEHRLEAMTAAAMHGRTSATPRGGWPRSRWTSLARVGGSRGERARACPPSWSGCTWSASAERACRASPASCSTGEGRCRAPTPRSRVAWPRFGPGAHTSPSGMIRLRSTCCPVVRRRS